MGLTLDDLRQPRFGGRIWGYDRDEVDQLLASVVVSIERLQRRRQRDADAVARATAEARDATARAERAAREREELLDQIELADEALEQAVRDADRRAERLVADAEERAARAEEALQALEAELAELAESSGLGGSGATPVDGVVRAHETGLHRLPLALRAARALLADARERAAGIEAEARLRADGPPATPMAEDLADSEAEDHSNRSGSSAMIRS